MPAANREGTTKYTCERRFFLELVRELDAYIPPYREIWADKKFFMGVLSKVPDARKEKAITKLVKKNGSIEYQEWLSENFPYISKRIAMENFCEIDTMTMDVDRDGKNV